MHFQLYSIPFEFESELYLILGFRQHAEGECKCMNNIKENTQKRDAVY